MNNKAHTKYLLFIADLQLLYQKEIREVENKKVSKKQANTKQVNISTNKARIKILKSTLAGVAQWLECGPAKQKVASSIPSQDT